MAYFSLRKSAEKKEEQGASGLNHHNFFLVFHPSRKNFKTPVFNIKNAAYILSKQQEFHKYFLLLKKGDAHYKCCSDHGVHKEFCCPHTENIYFYLLQINISDV